MLIENEDNSYSIYDTENLDANFNFNAENLVLAYISDGQLMIYTLEDNCLYLTWEESNGNKIINHKPVYIDESSAKFSSDVDYSYSPIKYALPSQDSLAIIKDDGTTYYASIGSVYELKEKDAFAIGTNSNYGLISDVDKIYADGSVAYYKHPFYSKKLDTSHLYVRDTNLTSPTTYSISLPEGYSTADIHEMHAIEEMLLVMNDGNIYYKENAEESTSWELIEDLSNLNKNSHIKSIVETNTHFLILCDDNYLYKLDI